MSPPAITLPATATPAEKEGASRLTRLLCEYTRDAWRQDSAAPSGRIRIRFYDDDAAGMVSELVYRRLFGIFEWHTGTLRVDKQTRRSFLDVPLDDLDHIGAIPRQFDLIGRQRAAASGRERNGALARVRWHPDEK